MCSLALRFNGDIGIDYLSLNLGMLVGNNVLEQHIQHLEDLMPGIILAGASHHQASA